MNKYLAIVASSALISTAAFAQTTTTPANTQAKPAATTASLQQQVKTNLQQAGFSDVSVMPDSFLVQAKDKSGNPITMMINPNSITEVVADNANGSQPGTAASPGNGEFTTVPATDMLTSKVVGLDVHNAANQDIGTIKDVAYAGPAVKAYIVGVGGFLGMGDHYVALAPSAVHIAYDSSAKAWHATVNATADQLKAAPEYKYPS